MYFHLFQKTKDLTFPQKRRQTVEQYWVISARKALKRVTLN